MATIKNPVCAKRLWVVAILLLAGQPALAEKITEPVTGHEFEAVVDGESGGRTLTCTGAGCRKKTGFGVKVYALAHYVDAKAAPEALAKWRGESGEKLASNQAFYDALSKADIEKRLQLVFVRNASAKKIRGAFADSLKLIQPELSPLASEFIGLFQNDADRGTVIELHNLPGGVIEVYEDGSLLGRLSADPALADAVWRIYFNKKLTDKHLDNLKPTLVSRMAEIW